MSKYFHILGVGVSVFPALLVLPAIADITNFDNTIKISENSQLELSNADWAIVGATGTAGSRSSLTGVNVDVPTVFSGDYTNIDVSFPNPTKRTTGVFVGHGNTPLTDSVHFSAKDTNINFYSLAGTNNWWPLALEVQNATAVFDGSGDVAINGSAEKYTSQVITSRSNSEISFENSGDVTINAKSPYGATGIVNEGNLSANIGGDFTINAGGVDENGNYDTSAKLNSNAVAIMTYANDINLNAKNVNLNSFGSGANYTANNDASDGTIVVEMEGGNVSVDADNLNIFAYSNADFDSKHNKSRGIMFVKNSAGTHFTTSDKTDANITVVHENGESYGIDFDTDNASTGSLHFGKDLTINTTGATVARGAFVNSGSDLTVDGDLEITANATGDSGKAYGIHVDGGDVTVGGDIDITVNGKNEDAYGIYVTAGNVSGNGDVDIVASNRGIRAEGATSNVELTGKQINISGEFNALRANNGAKIILGGENTESIELNSIGQLGAVARANSDITLTAKNIKISDKNGYYGILSQNDSHFNIDADNLNITADSNAIAGFSNSVVNVNGNALISGGAAAITARGGAIVNINVDNDKTTKMDGNIDFNYDALTSGTAVDAVVNVGLHGKDSIWNGNTVASYGTGAAPNPSYMVVNSVSLTLDNGAVWNATKITDIQNSPTSGFGYLALNNLNIDGGTVNIKDMNRGIAVERSNIANAEFNGGNFNVINELNILPGTTVFNGNIVGDNGVLNIADGATLNIGDAFVNQKAVHLNGNLIARLGNPDDNYRLNATTFDGTGTLSLAVKGVGEYKVFGDAVFESGDIDMTGITFDNPIYKLEWLNGGKILSATTKPIDEIVEKNHISENAATTVSNLAVSESEDLNNLAFSHKLNKIILIFPKILNLLKLHLLFHFYNL